MTISDSGEARLQNISPDLLDRNHDNPRLFFRSEEMDTLLSSIKRYGIQVPVTVYSDKKRYILIDGERRWRCATKLNLKSIPALVQQKPSELENLLLMFNIHALREQWDYFTLARKLPNVIDLFRESNGLEPNEIQLSEITGLTRGQIRRCRYLLDLPPRYRDLLNNELSLPKQKQQLSEDFFIEMERSLKTIEKRLPDSVENKNAVRDTLIEKFRKGIIGNVTDFRKLSKIATSIEKLGVREKRARRAFSDIFNPKNNISISDVFTEQFELIYDERKIITSIESLYDYISSSFLAEEATPMGGDIRTHLKKLRRAIDEVLKS